jgi:hypothetical protein
MTIGLPSVSRNEGIDIKGWTLEDTLEGRVFAVSGAWVAGPAWTHVVQIRELGSYRTNRSHGLSDWRGENEKGMNDSHRLQSS